MIIFRYFIFTLLLTCLLVSNLLGGELKRPMQGIRNLGMGNIGVALSHDENALFYNPAGMAGVDTIIVGFPFVFEISDDIVSLISEVQNLGNSSTGEVVKTFMGKRVHLRTMSNLNLIIPFGEVMTFGTIAGAEFSLDLSMRNPVSPEFKLGSRLDQQLINGGLAFKLGKGRWLVGIGIEKYKRCDLPISTISLGTVLEGGSLDSSSCSLTNITEGQTFSFGFQRRLESASTLRMVWGMSAMNLGGLKFERKSGETNPPDQRAEYNLGIAMTPFESMGFRNFYELDYRDITYDHLDDDTYCNKNKSTGDCIFKHIHLGTEFGFWPIDSGASAIALRFGWNQGYYSYGFELNPFIFIRALNIQGAVYKTETGDVTGTPESRKVLQFNLGF